MQLAGLLDGDWRQGPGGRSVVQNAGQTVAAQVLDRRWRKDQILEAYLNLVPFRGEVVGIDALSRTLFGKGSPWPGRPRGSRGRRPGARPQRQAGPGGAAGLRVLREMQPPKAAGLRCAGTVHHRRRAAARV